MKKYLLAAVAASALTVLSLSTGAGVASAQTPQPAPAWEEDFEKWWLNAFLCSPFRSMSSRVQCCRLGGQP